MNTKICTSLEQSKKLLSLGLDSSTADMHYLFFKDTGHIVNKAPFVTTGDEERKDGLFTHIDCWSLTALLELMPSSLPLYPEATEDGVKEGKYRSSDLIASKEGYLRKRFDGCYQYRYDGIRCIGDCSDPLDAAFKMVCWLIEQGHIKINK